MATYVGASTSGVSGVPGVKGTCDSPAVLPGIYGVSTTTANGVYGETSDISYSGVAGVNTGGGYGILGISTNTYGIGVYGLGNEIGVKATGTQIGVRALGNSYGIKAEASAGGVCVYGAWPYSSTWSGYFEGKVYVGGALSKAGGGFLIDHPTDPTNKNLEHSFC